MGMLVRWHVGWRTHLRVGAWVHRRLCVDALARWHVGVLARWYAGAPRRGSHRHVGPLAGAFMWPRRCIGALMCRVRRWRVGVLARWHVGVHGHVGASVG
jgi:hypothetical protein